MMMATLRFTASCQRGHDLVTFDGDRDGFERHMRQAHKATKRTVGGPHYRTKYGPLIPGMDAARPGGLPSRYLRPNRAPKTTAGLTKVLVDATQSGANAPWLRGGFFGVADDWTTDERVPASDLRPGDVFRFGRHDYTVREVHDGTWTISMVQNGTEHTKRLDERNAAKLRDAESVVIVKRAAA